MNQPKKSDNLVARLLQVRVVTEVSSKTNNEYSYLELTWNKSGDQTYIQKAFFQGTDWKEIIESLTVAPESAHRLD